MPAPTVVDRVLSLPEIASFMVDLWGVPVEVRT
jgi:hypothetical protein